MRTIKFRGFNKKNGVWLYGFYLQNRGAHFVCPDEFAKDKTWEDYEVEPESVGQFTGLQDAECVDIYEGDLLLSQECGEVFEVIYDAPHFVLNDNDLGYRFLNHPGNFMVIGTTHDIEKGGQA